MVKKALIFSAPSGSGKTTIVKALMRENPNLCFSISACSRPPRENEKNGKDYHFLSVDEFKKQIENDEFIEWEEVYQNAFYGTLKSEIERIWQQGKTIVFDVDVVGALSLKQYFKDDSTSIFIKPPSVNELKNRLLKRGSETNENLTKRLEKAKYEMTFAEKFDHIVENDILEHAIDQTKRLIQPQIK